MTFCPSWRRQVLQSNLFFPGGIDRWKFGPCLCAMTTKQARLTSNVCDVFLVSVRLPGFPEATLDLHRLYETSSCFPRSFRDDGIPDSLEFHKSLPFYCNICVPEIVNENMKLRIFRKGISCSEQEVCIGFGARTQAGTGSGTKTVAYGCFISSKGVEVICRKHSAIDWHELCSYDSTVDCFD